MQGKVVVVEGQGQPVRGRSAWTQPLPVRFSVVNKTAPLKGAPANTAGASGSSTRTQTPKALK